MIPSDRTRLLRAILDFPGEDTPRLALADEIECDEPARAEFIRVQCELARGKPCKDEERGRSPNSLPGLCGRCDLRRRELELWKVLGESFDMFGLESRLPSDSGIDREDRIVVVARGFVSHVAAPLAVLFGGGECRHCDNGTRSGGRLCATCGGSGISPDVGIAADLFACQPVERVTLTDREPNDYGPPDDGCRFGWLSGHEHGAGPAGLPGVILKHLPISGAKSRGRGYPGRWPTRDAAMLALSRAAVDLGRSRAAGWTHEVKCTSCTGAGRIWDSGNEWVPDPRCKRCRGTGTATRPGLGPINWETPK